jgi:hypothetical protein
MKIITQKELNELIEWLKPYTPDERLEMLLEAARTTGMRELEQAIISYWFDEEYVKIRFDKEYNELKKKREGIENA